MRQTGLFYTTECNSRIDRTHILLQLHESGKIVASASVGKHTEKILNFKKLYWRDNVHEICK